MRKAADSVIELAEPISEAGTVSMEVFQILAISYDLLIACFCRAGSLEKAAEYGLKNTDLKWKIFTDNDKALQSVHFVQSP